MTFVDLSFVVFLVAVAILYFVFPRNYRWVVLLAGSLTFFYLNSGYLLLVLLGTTLFTYLIARRIQSISDAGKQEAARKRLARADKKRIKLQTKKKCKPYLVLGVLVDLGVLLYLKYYNFFAENANVLLSSTGVNFPHINLLLPIGISFYTLQAIAYMTDVYRGKITADTNIAKFALFMSYFPQIVQGPIPRHKQLANQLYEGHRFDYVRMCHGCQLMIWGWFQKMVIADRIAVPVNLIYNNYTEYHGLLVFLAAAGYGLQVYADFQGGMDIARGFSEIIGIELELNFTQPYFSHSIEEFWRRWHITLGSWMRDYVFYPLSLSKAFVGIGRASRKLLGGFVGKRLPPIMAMFIVYFLVGFWHGAEWKYIAYGVWNGIFIVAGILLPEAYQYLCEVFNIRQSSFGWRTFQVFRTFCICALGRLFSRGTDLTAALEMFRSIGTEWWDISFLLDGTMKALGLDAANWLLLIVCIVGLYLIDLMHERGVHIRESIDRQHIALRWIIYLVAIDAIVIFGMYGTGYDSANFIYEQF